VQQVAATIITCSLFLAPPLRTPATTTAAPAATCNWQLATSNQKQQLATRVDWQTAKCSDNSTKTAVHTRKTKPGFSRWPSVCINI